jgi:hypothetical protein
MNQQQAEQALMAWASIERDELVRAAHAAGVSKNRIHLITGIARTTIDRILEATVPDEQTTRLHAYLTRFTADWPRRGFPSFRFHPARTVSEVFSAAELAETLFADAEFKALKLGTFLNTPNGQVLVAAVRALTPPLYRPDEELLVEALRLAATKQRSAAQDTVLKGIAVGIGVAALTAAMRAGAISAG